MSTGFRMSVSSYQPINDQQHTALHHLSDQSRYTLEKTSAFPLSSRGQVRGQADKGPDPTTLCT